MTKFSGSEEIYKELVSDSDESWILGLVAFAIIEEQKIEWMRHQEVHTGSLPDYNAIKSWYEQQPEGSILRAKGDAESALQVYSGEVIDQFLDDNKERIEEGILVNEIRELKDFWPQFGVNLAGGFASSLLFAIILIVFAFLTFNNTSLTSLGNDLKLKYEETINGEKRSNW